MLDAIGTIASSIALFTILVTVATRLTTENTQRLVLAVIAGAWVGIATAVANAHVFDDVGARGAIAIAVLFATPLVLAALVATFSARARTALLAFPMPVLIQLNLIRVLGALFLMLAAVNRLSGPFPYSAGWGDIITGAFALPVAWAATRNPNAQRLTFAWNAFGTLDLLSAVALGITSQNGSPLQLIHAGVGSAAIISLPWVLVPTVLVPFFLITHAVIFAQLAERQRRASEAVDRPRGPGAVIRADPQQI